MSEDVVVIAPNGRWSARTQTGVAAVKGFVFTFENQTRIPKPTYQDPGKVTLNTNPVRLDSKGEANIYWDITDTFYTIEVYAANQSIPNIPGELLYSQDNYPAVNGLGGGNIILNSLANNVVRNSQFTFWGNRDYLKSVSDTPQDVYTRLGTDEVICDDFIFERNNTSANIEISRGTFFPGQTDVPASPVNYLHYQSDTTGSGETYKAVSQKYQSADTFSGQEISIGLYAKSSTSSTIIIYITQNFGTGGSPSAEVITSVAAETLDNSWALYSGTVVIPSVAGKTFGTNGDDYIKLSVGYPLNTIANIDIANLQFHDQNTLPDFPANTINDQYKRLDAVVNETASTTGQYMLTLDDTEKAGWLLCDDETIGNYYSNATHTGNNYLQLFLLIWNKIPNSLAPIYNSDGTLGTRGSSAVDDWNDDKQLNLTRVLGRTFGAVGQPTFSEEFTINGDNSTAFTSVSQLSDVLLLSNAFLPPTGTPVTLTGGSLPSPLTTGVVYYVIKMGTSGNKFRLATNPSNSSLGISINITGTGTGTLINHNTNVSYTSFSTQTIYQLNAVSTSDIPTGSVVSLSTTGTLPAPLATSTLYYVININDTVFELASSIENLQSNTFINITTAGTGDQTFSIKDTLTLEDTYSLYTGTKVNFSTEGVLPAPLIVGEDYYVIYKNSTSIRLADSYNNAISGVPISFTSDGSDRSIITINYNEDFTNQNGQVLGEFSHAPIQSELSSHNHITSVSVGSSAGEPFPGYLGDLTSAPGDRPWASNSVGGSRNFNIIQPSFYTNCFLKL